MSARDLCGIFHGEILSWVLVGCFLRDGRKRLADAIAFDTYTHGYYKVTERVGEAFQEGLKLKK